VIRGSKNVIRTKDKQCCKAAAQAYSSTKKKAEIMLPSTDEKPVVGASSQAKEVFLPPPERLLRSNPK